MTTWSDYPFPETREYITEISIRISVTEESSASIRNG